MRFLLQLFKTKINTRLVLMCSDTGNDRFTKEEFKGAEGCLKQKPFLKILEMSAHKLYSA